ncbi:GNAT family N-acetyltransferase [Myxococcus faecalis]|uniref:GNAT family N-acetyltransferase n=1 Tax=Myxococcus faecalis TaxID=3115646 RepID=UPI003CEB51FE
MSRVPLRPELRLVPITAIHAPAMSQWMKDPEVRRGVGIRAEASLARTEDWIAQASLPGSGVRGFAILVDEHHVGNVVLDRLDSHLSTARLSIYIGEPEARGRGMGRRAVREALAHAFEALKLFKVWLTVHEENVAARSTYLSLGFREEGRLRGEFLLDGRRVDVIYMGILAEEFVTREQAAMQGEPR